MRDVALLYTVLFLFAMASAAGVFPVSAFPLIFVIALVVRIIMFARM